MAVFLTYSAHARTHTHTQIYRWEESEIKEVLIHEILAVNKYLLFLELLLSISHSINNWTLSIYHVPGAIQTVEDTIVNEVKVSALARLTF